jgi:hypothetical protein
MSPEARFQHNIAVIDAALSGRRNSGAELFHLCKSLVQQDTVRAAAPLAISLIEDALDRYARDNFASQIAAAAKEKRDA